MSKKLNDNVVECRVCNHFCKIPEGGVGFCSVRRNKKGDLKLAIYGKAIAVHIDPIEKKPFFHFYPQERVFSFGTIACNFRCKFCQNWDISQYKMRNSNPIGQDWSPEKIIKFCKENNIQIIAYTYNEPSIFFEYAYDTCKLAHKAGIKNVIVSNGYMSEEVLEKWEPYLDGANIDLKGFTEEFYQEFCGGSLEPVKKNIKLLAKSKVWLEITTLLITETNDSEKEIKNIAEFIASIDKNIPWHISRYFPNYFYNAPPTPLKTLEKAYQIGKKAGLNYVYLGNVDNYHKESTYCTNCGKIIIERERYIIKNKLKDKNKCPYCEQILTGVF